MEDIMKENNRGLCEEKRIERPNLCLVEDYGKNCKISGINKCIQGKNGEHYARQRE